MLLPLCTYESSTTLRVAQNKQNERHTLAAKTKTGIFATQVDRRGKLINPKIMVTFMDVVFVEHQTELFVYCINAEAYLCCFINL